LVSNCQTFPFVINTDPAVSFTPYSCDFDIRTFHNHKEVMHKYKLGPNGAIMTCLNLFASNIDKLHNEIAKQKTQGHGTFILDTPGQIEAFNWSASGQIIAQTLAASTPTVS
jgi:YD repeat-containing protein